MYTRGDWGACLTLLVIAALFAWSASTFVPPNPVCSTPAHAECLLDLADVETLATSAAAELTVASRKSIYDGLAHLLVTGSAFQFAALLALIGALWIAYLCWEEHEKGRRIPAAPITYRFFAALTWVLLSLGTIAVCLVFGLNDGAESLFLSVRNLIQVIAANQIPDSGFGYLAQSNYLLIFFLAGLLAAMAMTLVPVDLESDELEKLLLRQFERQRSLVVLGSIVLVLGVAHANSLEKVALTLLEATQSDQPESGNSAIGSAALLLAQVQIPEGPPPPPPNAGRDALENHERALAGGAPATNPASSGDYRPRAKLLGACMSLLLGGLYIISWLMIRKRAWRLIRISAVRESASRHQAILESKLLSTTFGQGVIQFVAIVSPFFAGNLGLFSAFA